MIAYLRKPLPVSRTFPVCVILYRNPYMDSHRELRFICVSSQFTIKVKFTVKRHLKNQMSFLHILFCAQNFSPFQSHLNTCKFRVCVLFHFINGQATDETSSHLCHLEIVISCISINTDLFRR